MTNDLFITNTFTINGLVPYKQKTKQSNESIYTYGSHSSQDTIQDTTF